MGEGEEDLAAGPVLGPVTALVVSAAEPDVDAISADSDAAVVLVAVTVGGVVTAAVVVIMPAAVAGAVPFAAVGAD